MSRYKINKSEAEDFVNGTYNPLSNIVEQQGIIIEEFRTNYEALNEVINNRDESIEKYELEAKDAQDNYDYQKKRLKESVTSAEKMEASIVKLESDIIGRDNDIGKKDWTIRGLKDELSTAASGLYDKSIEIDKLKEDIESYVESNTSRDLTIIDLEDQIRTFKYNEEVNLEQNRQLKLEQDAFENMQQTLLERDAEIAKLEQQIADLGQDGLKIQKICIRTIGELQNIKHNCREGLHLAAIEAVDAATESLINM